RAQQIRASLGGRKILFGVDRLDYTKGIGHRIKAFGELIASGELSVSDVVLVQVASPSRERVGPYRELRDEVELMVGRLGGDYSTLEHSPVSYYHQTFGQDEMAAMYLAADVMLVTALRDGMNLVAKEFVATRSDLDGVLVLSEFAGASDELRRAVLVNPHDIDGLKTAILRSLSMDPAERASRMRSMRKRVFGHDVAAWSASFLHELDATKGRS
ncbi:MAG TPA: trehalose-6-phosphate synthase, partial [Terrimesophilobacter sp.]|nr:trehalose-6-phosphate synthase [Terrimesophilobacter sp.]